MRCCVPGCGQRSKKDISFHTFPRKDPDRAKLWLDAILNFLGQCLYEKKIFTPKHDSVVCSTHFKLEDYMKVPYGRRMLKSSACPSVFVCDPNAKSRKRSKKNVSNNMAVKTLSKIAPRPVTDKIKNNSAVESLLPEISNTVLNINESTTSSAGVDTMNSQNCERICSTPTQKINKVQTSTSIVTESDCTTPTTSRCDDIPEVCIGCSILRQENKRLHNEILTLKDLVIKLTSGIQPNQSPVVTKSHCHTEEASCLVSGNDEMIDHTGPKDQKFQGESQQVVALDHCYDSTPRTLRRKLLSSETSRKRISKTSRLTSKKLQRTQLKVTEMKEMMRILVQHVDPNAKVSKHIEGVFGSVPLEIHKRSAGNKKVKSRYSPASTSTFQYDTCAGS